MRSAQITHLKVLVGFVLMFILIFYYFSIVQLFSVQDLLGK